MNLQVREREHKRANQAERRPMLVPEAVNGRRSLNITEQETAGQILPHPAEDPRNSYVIDLVPADKGWIVERMANEIAAAACDLLANFKVRIVDAPTGDADLTYFLPYSAQRKVTGSLIGSYFSHQEQVPEAARRFIRMAKEADFAICSARMYQDLLRAEGVDDVSVVCLGVDLDLYKPKLKIGVVGRTYHTGRKGEDLFSRLLDIEDVEFMFTGAGWPLPPVPTAANNLSDFYQSIDYLLIPSRIEGGPMPLFEALASGCEVISADVGCVGDFPHIPFKNGDAEDLRRVVLELREKKLSLRRSVESLTWHLFGTTHLKLFAEKIEALKPENFTRRLSKPQVAQAKTLPTLALISHGTEESNKGGPTRRINLIKAGYTQAGGHARIQNKQDDLNTDLEKKTEIVHVFNSWPLHSSIQELESWKDSGASVVFSPIALNLSPRPYFHHVVPEVLANCQGVDEIEQAMSVIWSRTGEWSRKCAPIQGVDKHYYYLLRAVAASDAIIYLSQYEQDFMNSIGAQPKRQFVVRNGIDTLPFESADPSLFEDHYGVKNFVLMVGRIEERKNQALVAIALRDLDVPVVAVGHIGDKRYGELLHHWAGDNFIHIDRISDRALLGSAYKAARCFVLASWAEGAPLVALEAGAAGTPLVLSTLASEQEYFGDWAQYVHPADIAGIRDIVAELVENPEDETRRLQRSKFTVTNFNIERHVKETMSVYEEVYKAREYNSVEQIFEGGKDGVEDQDVIDVSHMAHDLWSNRQLTGVTSVERSLVDVFLNSDRPPIFVLWNSKNRTYIRVPLEMMHDGTFYHLANTKTIPDDLQNCIYISKVLQLGDEQIGVRISSLRSLIRKVFKSHLKIIGLLATVTRKISNMGRRKGDRSIYPGQNTSNDTCTGDRSGKRRFGSEKTGEIAEVFPRVSRVMFGQEPLPFPFVQADRLFVFGQPWVSNDRQLEDMILFSRVNQLKLHSIVYDITYITDKDSFPEGTRKTYRERLLRLLRTTDTVIVTSLQVQDAIQALIKGEGLKCSCKKITLGVPVGRSQDCAVSSLPKELPSNAILYVSSFNQRKNHDFIISVWKEVRNRLGGSARQKIPTLILAGTPQEGFKQFGDRSYKAKLAADGIHVLNSLSDNEISGLYHQCLFTIYPSRLEGWGLPPMESAMAGKVCLVSNTVPSAHETKCAAFIRLDPNDREAWINAIISFIERPHMREAFEEAIELDGLPTWEDAYRALTSC